MSSDIRIKLSDFDAELLANIAEREGRTPEAVVLEALHELSEHARKAAAAD